MQDVLNIIEKIRKEEINAVNRYTNGECLVLALYLKKYFPKGHVIYLVRLYHFVFKLEGKYFDITGNVTSKYKNEKQIKYEEFRQRKKLIKMFKTENTYTLNTAKAYL